MNLGLVEEKNRNNIIHNNPYYMVINAEREKLKR